MEFVDRNKEQKRLEKAFYADRLFLEPTAV